MKFYRNAIILLVILAALGAAYAYMPKQNEKEKDEKEVSVKVFPKDSISEVELQNQKGLLSLTKDDSEWKMSKPKSYKLDKVSTESFIEKVYSFKAQSVVEENAQDLDNFGLVKPKATLTVKTSDGKSTVFTLGDETTIGEGYYLKTSEGNTVYNIDSSMAGELLRSTSEFRDKALFGFKPEDVTSLMLMKQGKEAFEFAKTTEWEVRTAEEKFKGDQTEIVNIIDKISSLKAKEFVIDEPTAADLAKYGLDNPANSILITFKEGKKEKLLAGKEAGDGGLYFKEADSTEVLIVNKDDISFINKKVKEFKAKP